MIKKGDIVEIIKKDRYCGMDYEVGTTWIVTDVDTLQKIITVYDGRLSNDEGFILSTYVKKVENDGLVEEPVPDPNADVKPVFIDVENLMKDIITKNWSQNEILAYLDGYMKGSK